MGFKHTYRRFLNLNIYHNYWLDDGQTAFDSNPTLKEEQVEKYELSFYMDVKPSSKTDRFLANQRILFKKDNKGIYLIGKVNEEPADSGFFFPFKELEGTNSFTFLLYVKDSLFENYSTVTANPVIPFYFSNVQPPTEGVGFDEIDLESSTTDIEEYTITEDTFKELKEQLNANELVGLFGIVQIFVEGDTIAKNVLNNDGTVKSSPNEYKIQIPNRSTIWHYRDAITGTMVHNTDPTELPLVKNGIVGYLNGSDEMPSATPNRLLFEDAGGGNIKTISEIYIN